MPQTQPILALKEVYVSYGSVRALKGVTIEAQEGELVALLGANGAGKTTTLMAISGILRPRSGSIAYRGHDLAKMKSDAIVQLGVMQCPEGRHIFGALSVLENLQMGAVSRKDRQSIQQELERVLSLFPILKQRIRQTSGTLSGGEQQMLAVGRALMARPSLLMLDEPSLGLAPLIVESIFNVIQQLHNQGMTILLVEQNARQALLVANHAYVLETGQIKLSGKVEELRTNPEVQRLYLGG